jgi:hypothetical protein
VARLSLAVLALSAIPAVALAQSGDSMGGDNSLFDRGRNVSVRERPRPDFDALGIRAGAFLVYPKVEASIAYEDNIFASETNEESDTVSSIAPSIGVTSQWSRHQLDAFARANVYRYADFNAQDSETYSVGASGRLDVLRGTSLRGGVSHDYTVESRSSASSPQNAGEPVRYEQTTVDFSGAHEFNRLRLSADFRYRDTQFEDTVSFTGEPIDESYRDNQAWDVSARADYALSPALSVYAFAAANTWDFANPTTPGDVGRDSDGQRAGVGADFDISRLVRGQAQVGYMHHSFDDPRVGDIDGLALLGKVEYFPSELLTLTFNAERSVQATGVIGAGGVLRTSVGGKADYELLRNLILSATRLTDDYQGYAREDAVWSGMLGAYYLVNRRIGVNLIYNYYNQESSGRLAGTDFAVNRIQLGVVVQY